MEDLFYNAGFGDYYYRINSTYLYRKNGVGWSIVTLDQIPHPIWSKLHYKQFDTMAPFLKAEGLLPETVQFTGERPAEKASEQGVDAAAN